MEKLSPDERVAQLAARLQVTFGDEPGRALALAALTHKSFANENKDTKDNERLEFLGDAVVDLAISRRLMERYPTAQEGELSKLRALAVNEEALATVARQLRLGELLLLGRGEAQTGGREKSSVLADAFEAVLGAVYLSLGMEQVMALVDRLFDEMLAGLADGKSGQDWKTHLQEKAQLALKLSPKYRVLSATGPEHEKTFEVEVFVGEAIRACATGRNKKEAEQAAARQALVLLEQQAAQG